MVDDSGEVRFEKPMVLHWFYNDCTAARVRADTFGMVLRRNESAAVIKHCRGESDKTMCLLHHVLTHRVLPDIASVQPNVSRVRFCLEGWRGGVPFLE